MIRQQALQAVKQYDMGALGEILQQVGNIRTIFRIKAGSRR